ncbi:MAG TPA: hypothetical protein VKD71_00180 [Gemmataceae bacterium]|nr:hypothetical protein [Gemmataceae bacterium]
MKRPVLVSLGVFAVIFLGALLVIERGNGRSAPKPPVPEFKMPDSAAKSDAAPEHLKKDRSTRTIAP